MMCLLGGMGTFFGPFIGAAILPDARKYRLALHRALAFAGWRGVRGLRAVLSARRLGHAHQGKRAMNGEVILRTRDVSKRFGKLAALNGVTAEFKRNVITSIIGPNGAGKSTYFNLLCGALALPAE